MTSILNSNICETNTRVAIAVIAKVWATIQVLDVLKVVAVVSVAMIGLVKTIRT